MHRRVPRLLGLLAVLVLVAATVVVLRARILTDEPGTTPVADRAGPASGVTSAPGPEQRVLSSAAPASVPAVTARAHSGTAARPGSASSPLGSSGSVTRSEGTGPSADQPPGTAVKKGASVWASTGLSTALRASGASWYYTWAAGHPGITAPAGARFVPMIWGADSATPSNLALARQAGGTLLGFNEPDMAGQANMTVAQALSLWPKLESTGLRLVSPAVAWGADQKGQWLDQFMTGAAARGYRVDAIAVHWYGSDFTTSRAVQQLRSYLAATWARYHKPIWLTEYALINFSGTPQFPSEAQQAAFVTASTSMLQGLSYVERYAWFALPTSMDGSEGTGLYWPGGRATPMGKAYAAA